MPEKHWLLLPMGVDMISPLGKEKDIPKEDIPCVGFKFMASVLGRPGWKWGVGGVEAEILVSQI